VVGKLQVEGRLSEGTIRTALEGKRAYKLTEYYCVTNGEEWAIVGIAKEAGARLLLPISDMELLSLPEETRYVEDQGVDTTNPTSMLDLADTFGDDVRAVVVQGEFNHMSFVIRDGTEVRVRVLDVVPPYPSKVAALARRALDCRPLAMVTEEVTIDLKELAAGVDPGVRLLFPCRASGLELGREVEYLDEVPDVGEDDEVVLVGCNLSERIFRFFNDTATTEIYTMCPLELAMDGEDDAWTLVKCCKEKGPFGIHGKVVAIPWSATKGDTAAALDEIYDRVTEERLTDIRNDSCGCQSCRPEHL
jgi:hypothetical protein